MSLKDKQKEVDEWCQQFKVPYWQAHEILARMSEEMGEIAREVNHLYGPKKKKPSEETAELGEEIGDLLFAAFCLANSKNIDLDEAWIKVMDKCYSRDKDRYEKK